MTIKINYPTPNRAGLAPAPTCDARVDHLPATFAPSYPLSCCGKSLAWHRGRRTTR